MSEQKPVFENRRDLTDFIIALLVIAFFLWLFLFSGFFNKKVADIGDLTDVGKVQVDTDSDGINDADDLCPNVFGRSANGCPLDDDGDGISNREDNCPKTKGTRKNNGCPEDNPATMDSDGDGVYDIDDKCPGIPAKTANGCPLDSDGDGVIDKIDRCPDRPGTAAKFGCPDIKIDKDDLAVLQRALKEVQFETGSAQLRKDSYRVLNEVQGILTKYGNAHLKIEGHTDNQGDKEMNMRLSRERAASCRQYLVDQGIRPSRIKSFGYGETRPQESNETKAGRAANRRVIFIID